VTPLERAARALHNIYTKEKERSGARNMPVWEELGPDGEFYFNHRARAAIAAIREPSEGMIEMAKNARHSVPEGSPHGIVFNHAWAAMIDALLAEGE